MVNNYIFLKIYIFILAKLVITITNIFFKGMTFKLNPTSASLTFVFTSLKRDILKIDSRDMLWKQSMNTMFSLLSVVTRMIQLCCIAISHSIALLVFLKNALLDSCFISSCVSYSSSIDDIYICLFCCLLISSTFFCFSSINQQRHTPLM